jgi:hypothetical protein
MNAYLCAILYSITGIQGNIKKQWGDCELEVLWTKKIENYLKINLGLNKQRQKDPT